MEPENPTFPTPPLQPTATPISPVFPKKNNLVVILLSVLLLVTLSTTVYLFLQVQSLTKQLAQIQVQVQPTPQTEIPSAPIVSPYIEVQVNKVEIKYLETVPVQVELVIQGTLPDQCKYDFYSLENRRGTNVKISLSGIHPSDTNCLQTIQNTEYVLRLGRDMPELERGFAPGDYELIVNSYQTTFSIK